MTLKVENLTYYYSNPDDYLFKDVTESFEKGTMYAILGQSGKEKLLVFPCLPDLIHQNLEVCLFMIKQVNQVI